nr:spectrin alpha chain, non-erythrocytic 1-like [Nothobranchius furzeri]XP_054602120.1 spectrin alpha chain, non-erythrocytic 1-like [Nothobranchius furzeri]
MAEEAPMVQAQQQEHLGSAPGKTVRLGVQTTANFNSIKELNNCWRSLQQLAEDRSNMLGSAHEVQRFHRDADETKEWIEEKNQALNTDNYGHHLASVQALQREHEGFERDLAALGDKVRFPDRYQDPSCLWRHVLHGSGDSTPAVPDQRSAGCFPI